MKANEQKNVCCIRRRTRHRNKRTAAVALEQTERWRDRFVKQRTIFTSTSKAMKPVVVQIVVAAAVAVDFVAVEAAATFAVVAVVAVGLLALETVKTKSQTTSLKVQSRTTIEHSREIVVID
jgi:hypothetical protein